MKQLIILITLLVVTLPQLCFAEDEVPALSGAEVIWETEVVPYLHGVLVAPQGELLYNINGKTLEIRRISDGVKIDSIVIDDVPNYLYKMSITDDGRYMAFSGDNPYVIIYDLQERREVKRITTVVYVRKEYGKDVVYNTNKWVSSSISPDGTKITGVVLGSTGEMTNFVVIDIATEKVLFEQRRITYDGYNPSTEAFEWMSAEFSPNGEYIVAQLDYGKEGDKNTLDSIYIYDANSFEVYDVVLNSYDNEYNAIEFSSYSPIMTFVNNKTLLYNLQSKSIIETNMGSDPWGLAFSRNTNHIIYGFDWNCEVYDIDSKETIYKYKNLLKAETTSMDNSKLISTLYGVIYCIKTYWSKTSVEKNQAEIIISPNPTNGLVNITLDCQSPNISYQINNTSGQILESKVTANNTSLVINFNSYPVGIYFLTVYCNQEPSTYKIIREN